MSNPLRESAVYKTTREQLANPKKWDFVGLMEDACRNLDNPIALATIDHLVHTLSSMYMVQEPDGSFAEDQWIKGCPTWLTFSKGHAEAETKHMHGRKVATVFDAMAMGKNK